MQCSGSCPRYDSLNCMQNGVKKIQCIFAFFLCFQRVYLFSAYATSVMCKAGVEVIDVYPLTDSYPDGTLDSVHYANQVFDTVEQMLEKYKVDPEEMQAGFTKRRFKTCTGWEK